MQTNDEAKIRTDSKPERQKRRYEYCVSEGFGGQNAGILALNGFKIHPKRHQNRSWGTPVEGLGTRSQKGRKRPGKNRPQGPSLDP